MKTDTQLLERQVDVLAFLARLDDHMGSIAGMITQALAPNGVLATQTAVIGPDGTWTKDFQGRFAAVSVANHGGTQMHGAVGGPMGSAPMFGPGVFPVPAGGFQVVNLADNAFTLYGAPGDTATVQVFVDPQGPAFGAGGGAAGSPSTSVAGGTPTVVGATTGDQLLLAGNAARRGMTVYNDSTADLYLALGFVSSTTAFTIKIAGGGYYEVPYTFGGAVHGTWSSATGQARITEFA